MRNLILATVAASALTAAVPAAAQAWRVQPGVHRQIQQDLNQLDRRINRAAQRGTISRREAAGLQNRAVEVQRLYQRYSRNGLDRREVNDLETRVNYLHQRLRYERRDWDNRRG